MEDAVADRDLLFGSLGQGDADRVAQAVSQQGGDTRCAFDAAVVAVSGFGDPEVQGLVVQLGMLAGGHLEVGRQDNRRR